MKITEKEFNQRQAKYLEEQGPSVGCNWLGHWGWNASKKHEFRDLLRAEGYEIPPEPIDVEDTWEPGDDEPKQ